MRTVSQGYPPEPTGSRPAPPPLKCELTQRIPAVRTHTSVPRRRAVAGVRCPPCPPQTRTSRRSSSRRKGGSRWWCTRTGRARATRAPVAGRGRWRPMVSVVRLAASRRRRTSGWSSPPCWRRCGHCRRSSPRGARSRWSPTRPTSSTASGTGGTCAGRPTGGATRAKQPVANADLWKPLVDLVQRSRVSFRWVKGHGDGPAERPRRRPGRRGDPTVRWEDRRPCSHTAAGREVVPTQL